MTTCNRRDEDLFRWPVSTIDGPALFAARRIGFLGPHGTFTEEALQITLARGPENVMEAIETRPYPSIEDTIRALADDEIDCVLVPIENSIEGSVSVTVDVLAWEAHDVQIIREVRLPIRHRLITRPEVHFAQITKIISHPHANAQCRRWLRRAMPSVPIEAANSTAGAVKIVSQSEEPWAAIGTAIAAERYGCVVMRDNIEDHDDNETRFVFLSRVRERQDFHEPYKTSVVCEIMKDQPGALLLILQEFAHRYINLTKVESRPSKRRLGDYIFLVDMEGKLDDLPVHDALACLTCKLPRLTVLGSYPIGKPPVR
ncbi:MAG: prephenate dehydratase [Actinobacteria bacterium]|nr:prephenate dehydratase [Actinomycetota bacterium]